MLTPAYFSPQVTYRRLPGVSRRANPRRDEDRLTDHPDQKLLVMAQKTLILKRLQMKTAINIDYFTS